MFCISLEFLIEQKLLSEDLEEAWYCAPTFWSRHLAAIRSTNEKARYVIPTASF